MINPYIVFWENRSRVFGSYPTKEAAREAVEEKIRSDPQFTLSDFILTGPKQGEHT